MLTPSSPGQEECRRLIALADRMVDAMLPGDLRRSVAEPERFAEWRTRALALMEDTALDTPAGELKLDGLMRRLRHAWLLQVHHQSSANWMSPPHGQAKRLADGQRIGYPYDRWLKPELLERRAQNMAPAPDGWVGETVLCASGMAALGTVLQYYKSQATRSFERPNDTLSLHWFGGYFEITRLLRLLCDTHLQGRKHAEQTGLSDAVKSGRPDLILIEPVAADYGLEVFDLDAFAQAWKARKSHRPTVIVVDTSLTAHTFSLEMLCQALGSDHPPAMVIEVRSAVKLDQQGLELANAGVMQIYCPDDAKGRDRLNTFAHGLRLARTTLGTSLSQDEYAALYAPFVFDADSFSQHADNVFANTARFAHTLHAAIAKHDGLFDDVSHPTLQAHADRPWAVAPYVNLAYRADGEDSRTFLRAVLEDEAYKRELSLVSGSSFGFRNHRFEMGFVQDDKNRALRVAIGSRNGPALDGVIALFEELAAYPDFTALRAAYPEIASIATEDAQNDAA